MHIYIDESGNFVIPTSKSNYISCVVALTIPSSKRQYLFDRFLKLRTSWGSKNVEIKGSTLDEKQIAKVTEILRKYEVIAEIFAIDGLAQSQESITDFRQRQADRLMEHVGPDHHPEMVRSLEQLQDHIRRMPNQLFVQAFLSTLLCEEVVRIGTLYWSQRVPKELGEFIWTIDAKDKTVTQTEKMWRTLLMPFLEARSFSHPLGLVNDPRFDYTYLEKLAVKESDEDWKNHFEWLRKVNAVHTGRPVEAIDMRPIFHDLNFANSQDEVGLQLADIIANAFHRACKGTLQREGWKNLGALFILRRESVVHLIALGRDLKKSGSFIPVEDQQVRDVLSTIRRGSRSMSAE